ncbi:hypothetical protein NU219Hw_g5002t1 [Hortaea werneckii]
MDFPHQRRVAPSNNSDGNQQLFKLYSPPPQGYAPLSSSRGVVPPFLLPDDQSPSMETSSYQSDMFNKSHNLGSTNTPQQSLGSFQSVNPSAVVAQRSAIQRQASQLGDERPKRELHFTPAELNLLFDARFSHSELEVALQGMNRPPQHPETWPGTPTFTDPALPITASNSKRRKVKASFDAGPSQTSTAKFTASQQESLYSTEPMPTAYHNFNRTHHGPAYNLGSMPTAESDFTEMQQEPVRRKARMQNAEPNFTASQQRPSNSVHPATNTPSPSHGQAFNYSSPAYSFSPPLQYQQSAMNHHDVHQNVRAGPASDQYGFELPSASMPPAQPTSRALMPFSQHDNVPSPSTSPEQDFTLSYPSSASPPPFNTQQPGEFDIFDQDFWSSPSSGQYGDGSPMSSIPTAQLTPPSFFQDNQQGNNLSSGPQVNVYQQNNVLSSGAQVNQPFNVISSGPQANQQSIVPSSGPQVNQQGVGIPPANMPLTQPAHGALPHINQQGNTPSNGPQANQQNNVPPIGQQVNLQRNVVRSPAGIHRVKGHNADMKALHAIPPNAALPAMELSLTEILTYFPNHLTSPYVMLRFKAAGASVKRIAQAQLLVRGVIDDNATKSIDAKIRQQTREAGNVFFGRTVYTALEAENQLKTLSAGQVSYDVSAYSPRAYYQNNVRHMTLVEIARGVTVHPTGQDAGIFTQVVQYVLSNLNTLGDTTTAGVQGVIALAANQPHALTFSRPLEAATDDWDKKCLERMILLLKANGMH